MKLTCENCRAEILNRMKDVPSSWRDDIANSICTVLEESNQISCEDVKECETVTNLSEFYLEGTNICIRYTNEDEVTVERCFDVSELISDSLNEVNPNCVATSAEWVEFDYVEKWQAIIDRICLTCVEPPTTVAATTKATTTQAPTTQYIPATIVPTTVIAPTTVQVTTQAPIPTTTQPPTTAPQTTIPCPVIVGADVYPEDEPTTTVPPGPVIIEGVFDAKLSMIHNVSNPGTLHINFFEPLPVPIYFEWGFDITPNEGTDRTYEPQSYGYPLPRTYSNYFSLGGTEAGVGLVIPVGTTTFVDETTSKTLLSGQYGNISKVVLFNTIIPAGYELRLTAMRDQLALEIR